MSGLDYLEGKVAEMLGVSTATLRKGRKKFLVEGEHFGLIEHENRSRMAYTHKGVRVLLAGMSDCDGVMGRATARLEESDIALVLSSALVRPHKAEKEGDAGLAPDAEPKLLAEPWTPPDAVVISLEIKHYNTQLVFGMLSAAWVKEHGYDYFHRFGVDAATQKVRVKVRTNENFIAGMEMRVRWKQSDYWECTQRMPRWRGRW